MAGSRTGQGYRNAAASTQISAPTRSGFQRLSAVNVQGRVSTRLPVAFVRSNLAWMW
jgi:hypothetical protein